MKDLMPDEEMYMVSLREGVFKSKLGLKLQTGNEISVPRRNGRDQQSNCYCINPVTTMNRFIGQPKFAGKTHTDMKFVELLLQQSRVHNG